MNISVIGTAHARSNEGVKRFLRVREMCFQTFSDELVTMRAEPDLLNSISVSAGDGRPINHDQICVTETRFRHQKCPKFARRGPIILQRTCAHAHFEHARANIHGHTEPSTTEKPLSSKHNHFFNTMKLPTRHRQREAEGLTSTCAAQESTSLQATASS